MFDVLVAYQDHRSTPARLVLAGPGWYLLTGPQFRRLADIIKPVMMPATGQCAESSGG